MKKVDKTRKELIYKLKEPIYVFGFSLRILNILCVARIELLGELVQKTECELLSLKRFGHVAMNEVRLILQDNKLFLGMELTSAEKKELGDYKKLCTETSLSKKELSLFNNLFF